MKRMVLGLIVVAGMLHAESFVVKKNKKPSTHSLRESCCDSFFCAVKESPKAARQLAEIQDLSFNIMPDMVEGAYFKDLSKDQLASRAKKMEQFEQRQAEINKLIQQQLTCARELTSS